MGTKSYLPSYLCASSDSSDSSDSCDSSDQKTLSTKKKLTQKNVFAQKKVITKKLFPLKWVLPAIVVHQKKFHLFFFVFVFTKENFKKKLFSQKNFFLTQKNLFHKKKLFG